MGVKFKDFTRKQTGSSFWSGDTFESLEATVQTASAWSDEHGIQVINIETVVMPSSAFSGGEIDTNATPDAGGKYSSTWHQFIRVWYRD
ncbi:hypothetical protein [Burkholderia ubonensis]|uniref:hypothetical protein n=1 Tax=Burkholderia ubonensis TaxID=101571 RepID=UPI000759E3C0|nr:hypothetical protein [Burkholderia ubonensis]KVP17295.1 hypothetical protein WJ84_03435 [Burkholderia ubonensis]